MKTIILSLCFALCALNPAQATGQHAVAAHTETAGGFVKQGSTSVTFIFSASFTGTISGAAFAGATDGSLTVNAPSGDTLGDIYYTVTAGSVRIVEVK